MGSFKKYVTSIMTFFTLFIFVKLSQFYSINSPVLSTKSYGMKEKKMFYIYGFFRVSRDIKGDRESIFRHN